jgi:hypothetical protein
VLIWDTHGASAPLSLYFVYNEHNDDSIRLMAFSVDIVQVKRIPGTDLCPCMHTLLGESKFRVTLFSFITSLPRGVFCVARHESRRT